MPGTSITSRTRVGRIIYFVALAIAFSWSQWLAVISSQRGWLTAQVPLSPVAIFGPLVAALIVVTISDKRKWWFRSLFEWRMGLGVGLVAIFLPPLLFVACLAMATGLTAGAPYPEFPPLRVVVAASVGMFLVSGVGEEPGWRGFLLPELRKSLGSFVASIVVAITWFLWHVPLFWIVGATQRQIGLLSFAIGLLAYSFILTWLVEVSNNSTLPAMLFHASANVSFWIAISYVRNLPQYPLLSSLYLLAMAVCGAFAAVLLIRRERNATLLRRMAAG